MRRLLALPLVLLSTLVLANDAWVGYGGAPKVMKDHSSIRLDDERVVIMIRDKTVKVDCAFEFQNEGPATTVRMGFPDYDSHAEYEGGEGEGVQSLYSSFVSYVNGKKAKMSLVADGRGRGWQVKTVKFKRGQRIRVRNIYEMKLGGSLLGGSGGILTNASYILNTGSSWKGKIGRTEVVVVFLSKKHPMPNRLVHPTEVEPQELYSGEYWRKHPRTLIWTGPNRPRISGNMIFYTRENWEPQEKHDIDLAFMSRNLMKRGS